MEVFNRAEKVCFYGCINRSRMHANRGQTEGGFRNRRYVASTQGLRCANQRKV